MSTRIKTLIRSWLSVVSLTINPLTEIKLLLKYLKDRHAYSRIPGSEKLGYRDNYPQIYDSLSLTPFDTHYTYQSNWALGKIFETKPDLHTDIGSQIQFVTSVSVFSKIIFVDIRPIKSGVRNLYSLSGNILSLPFLADSLQSLSCLHVAEHIGLGRYGDALNPSGTKVACCELSRVLAPGGNLLFSIPIGRTRVCFNAHRIYDPMQIIEFFEGLTLREFSAVSDDGKLHLNANLDEFRNEDYGCGLFWFTK
jgi:hypothetical protein